jgi:hypothetical protein
MKPLVDSKDYAKSRVKNLKILMNISKYPEIYSLEMKKERNLFAKKVMKDKIVFKLILD